MWNCRNNPEGVVQDAPAVFPRNNFVGELLHLKIKNQLKMVKSVAQELKTLTPTEAAYLAGLIDGEGCFFIQKAKHKKFQYTPKMAITNTSSVIASLCDEYGGSYQCQEHTVNWKSVYRWHFSKKLVTHYLPQILPYLKIKSAQATLMLECLSSCKGTGYVNDDNELERYRQRLMELNARGKKKGRNP